MTKTDAIKSFDFSPLKPIIFFLGGSQGSKAINQIVKTSLDYLVNSLKTQIIWQTGRLHFEALRHYAVRYPSIRLYPFLEDVGPAYSAADLIISRAGALTLAEIAWCAKPSLLIPLPGSAADHQTKNANSFKLMGAAIILSEEELSTERFINKIEEVLSSPKTLSEMSHAAKSLSIPDSTGKIVDQILALTNR